MIYKSLIFHTLEQTQFSISVHTTEDLSPGDEVTTSYSVEENTDKRLKELKEKYGFDCECGKCVQ